MYRKGMREQMIRCRDLSEKQKKVFYFIFKF